MTSAATTACDTSVLVPALIPLHPDHVRARRALAGSVDAVPVHVLLEAYSVLTRLPTPYRYSVTDAGSLIDQLQLTPVALGASHQRAIVLTMARAGIGGGAVYDGLVAATARHHDLLLLTSDQRARATYDVLGARYQVV